MVKRSAAIQPTTRKEADPKQRLDPHAGGQPGGPVELDRLIHERVRLLIVSSLAVEEPLSFNDLKRLLDITDGNLSIHARKLEEAGYVECTKRFEGRTPRTEYRLTETGRRALSRYLDHMGALIETLRRR